MEAEMIERLKKAAAGLFPAHGVLAAYVYGSRVAGRALPGSDLDVGYYLKDYRSGGALSLRVEMGLAADLSERLEVEVDLRNLAEAPLEMRGRILEEGVRVFSSDEPERVALERDLLGRYHDYKDVFRQMHLLRLRQFAARGA